MTTQDDLDQLLWDYVFGLLEPEEARALEARITSEHDVARAYSEVRQRADMLGAAARLEIGPVKLNVPQEPVMLSASMPLASGGMPWISWCMASAALVLVGLMGYTWQRHGWLRDPQTVARVEKTMAAEYRRVIVCGPAELKAHASNHFTVQLEDLNGVAVNDEFCVKLQNGAQDEVYQGKANADGIGHVAVDGRDVNAPAKLSTWSHTSPQAPPVELNVAPAEANYTTYLALNRTAFEPGETVFWRSVSLPQQAKPQPVAREFALGCAALAPQGESVATTTGLTQNGVGNGKVELPKDAALGRYVLSIDSPDPQLPAQEVTFQVGQQATLLAGINSQTSIPEDRPEESQGDEARVGLQFFAEGGKLVPGMKNKLHFEARDAQQQPVEIKGKIVDSRDNEVTTFSSSATGRGEVEFTPQQDETYYFSYDGTSPKSANDAEPLPAVETDVTARLSTDSTIVGAGDAIKLDIATTKTPTQLLVAAHCNGELVGQQFVDFDMKAPSKTASQQLALPVADTAAGLMRVSLYDLNDAAPKEVSQQFVYRQPAHYFKVSVERESSATEEGTVDWLIRVRDEEDRPCPATLGINVVKDTGHSNVAQVPSLVAAWYCPPSDVQGLAERGRWDFSGEGVITGERHKSLAALDFAAASTTYSDLAATANMYRFGAMLGDHDAQDRFTRVATTAAPPAIADNLREAESAYQRAMTEWRDREQNRLQAFAMAITVGSVLLLMALALLLTFRTAGRATVWLPALGACTAALVIGVSWLGVRIEPSLQIAARPVRTFDGEMTYARGFSGGGGMGRGLSGAPASLGVGPTGGGVGGGGGFGAVNGPTFEVPPRVEAVEEKPAPPTIRPLDDLAPKDPTSDAPVALPAEATPGPSSPKTGPADDLSDVKRGTEDTIRSGPLPKPVVSDNDVQLRPTEPDTEEQGNRSPVQQLAQQPAAFAPLPIHRWGEVDGQKDAQRLGEESHTVYWNPLLETNDQGEARLRFAVPPGVHYRIVIDAHGNGRIGSLVHREKTQPAIHALPAPAPSEP